MKEYIGTKMIQAEPAFSRMNADGRREIFGIFEATEVATGDCEFGYKVVYPDGYTSWSPKDVFEAAYRETDGMNFGLAIEAAKMGKKIARKGWNGKNQYVELGYDFAYTAPGDIPVRPVQHLDIGSQALVFVGTRGRQVGWLASQSDMLADDWYIVG